MGVLTLNGPSEGTSPSRPVDIPQLRGKTIDIACRLPEQELTITTGTLEEA